MANLCTGALLCWFAHLRRIGNGPPSKCSLRGLSPRPMAHKTIALTTELRELVVYNKARLRSSKQAQMMTRASSAQDQVGMEKQHRNLAVCCRPRLCSEHRLISQCAHPANQRIQGACGLMDKALVFGTKDCRFESCQAHVHPQGWKWREHNNNYDSIACFVDLLPLSCC